MERILSSLLVSFDGVDEILLRVTLVSSPLGVIERALNFSANCRRLSSLIRAIRSLAEEPFKGVVAVEAVVPLLLSIWVAGDLPDDNVVDGVDLKGVPDVAELVPIVLRR